MLARVGGVLHHTWEGVWADRRVQEVALHVSRFVRSIWAKVAALSLLVEVLFGPLAGVAALSIATLILHWSLERHVRDAVSRIRRLEGQMSHLNHSSLPSVEESRMVVLAEVRQHLQRQRALSDTASEPESVDIETRLALAIHGSSNFAPVQHCARDLRQQFQGQSEQARLFSVYEATRAAWSNGYRVLSKGPIHWLKVEELPAPEIIDQFPKCQPLYGQAPPSWVFAIHSLDALLQIYFPAEKGCLPFVWAVGSIPIVQDLRTFTTPLQQLCLRSTLAYTLEQIQEEPAPEHGNVYALVKLFRDNIPDLFYPLCAWYSAYYFITKPPQSLEEFAEVLRNALRLAMQKGHKEIVISEECTHPFSRFDLGRCLRALCSEPEFRMGQSLYLIYRKNADVISQLGIGTLHFSSLQQR